jgi:threonine dehydratase
MARSRRDLSVDSIRSTRAKVKVTSPLEKASAPLRHFTGCNDLWLKREDAHELGVFKWRSTGPVLEHYVRGGATGVVTCSTGNHGAAVAWAARQLGIPAHVFVPPGVVPGKLARLKALGGDVRVAGADLDSAKEEAAAFAGARRLPFFEDGAEPLQYDAYGAIAAEIVVQAPGPIATVVVPVGNGALAGGIGAALHEREPAAWRVGVVAEAMPVMADSYEKRRPARGRRGVTIADGLAVRVAIPLAVDRIVGALDAVCRVSERQIAEALVACHDAGVCVEPSAATTIAALRGGLDGESSGTTVVVLTGRNFDPAIVDRARRDLSSFAA